MTKVKVFTNILKANENIAQKNRDIFDKNKVYTINLMSSPGSGKTSLLERTINLVKNELKMAVLEGDLQTDNDAQRIKKYDIPVVQINTNGACHLDANMVDRALKSFDFKEIDLFVIENVGNLVCPASFELGEHDKAVMVSTTEGDDKPIKYPVMFRKAKVLLINKIDLLPYTNFNMSKIKKDAMNINPEMRIFEISCRTGEGLGIWIDWLKGQVKKINYRVN
ncbi:MAG TPA: hydrogenase accessory protein HypB [Candidatus Atribacteria bacterium]|nr:hydrogenase accessory protein HypB [Candidatus Atribacteria bacterium]